jgi:D-alanine transfer protein
VVHLTAAVVSVLLVAGAVLGGERYALSLKQQYIHAIAPAHSPSKDLGTSLQREALRQPDLLPINGSSELLDDENPYNGSNFFHDYPTGFAIFPIGDVGTTTLIMVQRLAAIGPDLQGKRVVISLSPYWYFAINDYREEYAGSFSRLDAGELAFSTQLSFATKQEAARRMLEYPQTLADDPVLHFALEQLAGGSAWNTVLYYTVFPWACCRTACWNSRRIGLP